MGDIFKGKTFSISFGITQEAGIGEMVDKAVINTLNYNLNMYGHDMFNKLIFDGEAASVAYAYLHPSEEMRATKGFSDIQRAFMNAYF